MPSLAPRLLGLAFLAFFLFLFLFFLKYIVAAILVFLAVAVIGGLLFYVRVRLALRRFQKAFAKASEEIARRQQAGGQASGAQHPGAPAVIDAEFKVDDEPR